MARPSVFLSPILHSLAFVSGIVAGTSWPLPAAFALAPVLFVRLRVAAFWLLLLVGLGQGMAIRSAWARIQTLDGLQATVVATVTDTAERPVGTNIRLAVRRAAGRSVGRGGVTAWVAVRATVARGESVLVHCARWVVKERPGALAFQTPSLRCPEPQVLERRAPSVAVRWLEQARQRFVRALEHVLPEPAASLAVGLTLGDTTTLPPQVVEDFRMTGTSHILALSGYNVTLLVVLLLAFLPALVGKRSAMTIIALALVAFLVLTGVPASLLRATAMAGLLLIARWVGRRSTAGRSLALTLIALLLAAPSLVFDLGFALSVASTGGLIAFGERWSNRLPLPTFLSSTLGSTLAAIVATLPLIVSLFGRIALVAPLANLVVLPLVPVLFFSSLAIGGMALILPGFAATFAIPVNWAMLLFLKTISWFAHWPAASVTMRVPNILPWIVPLVFLGAVLRYHPRVCQKCSCPERSFNA